MSLDTLTLIFLAAIALYAALIVFNIASQGSFKDRLLATVALSAVLSATYTVARLYFAALEVSGGDESMIEFLPNLVIFSAPALLAGGSAGVMLSAGTQLIRSPGERRRLGAAAMLLVVSLGLLVGIAACGFLMALLWVTG